MTVQSASTEGVLARTSDKTFYAFNAILSIAALSFLAYILVIRRGSANPSVDLGFLPAVDAALNATAATLLVVGYVAIKRGRRTLHQYSMVSAFAVSSLFLVCYLTYHSVHGDTKFLGHGAVRPIYFLVLITHIVLSAFVVPLSLSAFFFAGKKRFATHRKLGKWLFPIWLYVSVTGVVIYFMLRFSGSMG